MSFCKKKTTRQKGDGRDINRRSEERVLLYTRDTSLTLLAVQALRHQHGHSTLVKDSRHHQGLFVQLSATNMDRLSCENRRRKYEHYHLLLSTLIYIYIHINNMHIHKHIDEHTNQLFFQLVHGKTSDLGNRLCKY